MYARACRDPRGELRACWGSACGYFCVRVLCACASFVYACGGRHSVWECVCMSYAYIIYIYVIPGYAFK